MATVIHYYCMGFFIAAHVINAIVLLIDWYLLLSGQTTISQYVWERPVLGLPIIAFEHLAVLALTIHLFLPIRS